MILIAGPCVIESMDNLRATAHALGEFAARKDIDFYFKSSFDKANRTSLESYRGPGLQEGLAMLDNIKREFGYQILTDIHESAQAAPASEVADVLQVPAFLCRQTDLIVACAKTKAIVNIKKGQFMNPSDMRYSALKALKTRDEGALEANYAQCKQHKIWLTERGNSFGYGNLVVDMRSLVMMRNYAPVIFDATHSVQMPGAAGGKSGGESRFAPYLARAASAVGIDGLFAETHISPKDALSDGANMLTPEQLRATFKQVMAISELKD
ncbi:MAG: 3-deoxy-8-phosphooctulonate synthase [Helicobacter sp.]|nr:3-deoxy-8-phosphooctulonate synthase [Helicobacter sp.]